MTTFLIGFSVLSCYWFATRPKMEKRPIPVKVHKTQPW